MSRPDVPRSFIASHDGIVEATHEEHIQHMGISPAVSAACDLLMDDGLPAEEAAMVALGAERSGQDPEALARKLLRLRRTFRNEM